MKRDIIIGVVVSILLHVGFLFGGEIFKPDETVEVAVIEEPLIELMEMPEMLPEEEEIIDITDEAPPEDIPDIAPPMLTDVPAQVQVDSFVQKIQPPPPPGMERPTGVVTIPVSPRTGNFGAGMRDLFNLSDLDQVPVPSFQSRPVYPFEMRRAGITGEVVVGFIVDSTGAVRDAYAVRSTQREFEAAAVQAVTKWKFRPGRRGGRAVNTRMQVPIVFSITD